MINHRSGIDRFRWFVTCNAAARDAVRDSRRRVTPILSPTVQRPAARWLVHLSQLINASPRPPRVTLQHSRHTAKSPSRAALLSHHLPPRFRAWRFSAAGRLSALKFCDTGGRKPAHFQT